MKIFLLFLVVWITPVAPGKSQIINRAPLSDRQTGYKIDAVLDPYTKTVTAVMDAYWVNKSPDTVPDIRLHLYMNAFKNDNTTLYKESGNSFGDKEHKYGWINIKSFTDKAGNDLLSEMSYISPDDGNSYDQTVVKVVLPNPVISGDTVFIKVNFETKLPSLIMRTGYKDDFYFVAQWFPKFGVYESSGMRYSVKGAWNCHQFHRSSEFYANHSLYDIKISLPQEFVVGSCGLLIDEAEYGDSLKTLTYRAEDIVDFAWTAWPGYTTFTDKWEHVSITLLLPKERYEQVNRQFTAVRHALEYFKQNVGPYPWPYLTIVDPPSKGAGSGGMEYTTLFTSASSYMMPEFFHLPEMTTIHEFGHAYFMGILASNEFEEPWLDEGVTTFWEERIVDHYYGTKSGLIDHHFIKVNNKSMGRLSYIHSAGRQVVSNNEFSWNYPHGTYGMMSYNKTATWLYTLMGITGEETTNEIFREYYKKWAFRHPSGRDFVNIVNEVVTRVHGSKFGANMDWFFDQTLYGTGICDYKVAGIYNQKLKSVTDTISEAGISDMSSGVNKQLYKSRVEIERTGEIMLPVDILIHFNNGDELYQSWDGRSRFIDFEYTGTRTIEWVKIDPEYKITMDINFINNSMTEIPDSIPVRRLTNKLISFMQFFISFMTL